MYKTAIPNRMYYHERGHATRIKAADRAATRAMKETGDIERAKAEARKARAIARGRGATPAEASRIHGHLYRSILRQTCDKAAVARARSAARQAAKKFKMRPEAQRKDQTPPIIGKVVTKERLLQALLKRANNAKVAHDADKWLRQPKST